jgi:TetR/AcrR family transcriptional repressor of nem operon
MLKRKIQRKDIVQTGYNLMYLKGYNAVSIKDITETVKIPKGSFYNHFDGKENFGLEVLEFYTAHIEKQLNNRLSDRKKRPIARLKDHFGELIRNFDKKYKSSLGCLAGNLGAEMADSNPVFREAVERSLERFVDALEACIGEAQTIGQIGNASRARDLAEYILNSWEGALLKMKTEKSIKPLKIFYDITFQKVLV